MKQLSAGVCRKNPRRWQGQASGRESGREWGREYEVSFKTRLTSLWLWFQQLKIHVYQSPFENNTSHVWSTPLYFMVDVTITRPYWFSLPLLPTWLFIVCRLTLVWDKNINTGWKQVWINPSWFMWITTGGESSKFELFPIPLVNLSKSFISFHSHRKRQLLPHEYQLLLSHRFQVFHFSFKTIFLLSALSLSLSHSLTLLSGSLETWTGSITDGINYHFGVEKVWWVRRRRSANVKLKEEWQSYLSFKWRWKKGMTGWKGAILDSN